MSLPELFFAAVVLLVGIPAAFRNPTAFGLVIAWALVTGMWYLGGRALLVDPEWSSFIRLVIDIAVVALIYCKPPTYDCYPYRNIWRQLCALWFERSVWDRIVIAAFVIMWASYFLPLEPYEAWWLQFMLSVGQFLAAGGESLETYRIDRAANADEAAAQDTPSSSVQYAWAGGYRESG